jgi:DNA modification methylase
MSTWILEGDCVESLRGLPDACIDAVVTDPPYGLSKEPDMLEVLRHWLAGDDYQHSGGGFMGKTWDSFVPGPAVWREVFRVLKPGGHVLSFAGTRTYDLMVTAIRIAGFEIRDQLAWMYGSGFPKSLDVSKAIDKIDRIGPMRDRALQFTAWMRSTGITAAQVNAITDTCMGSHYLTDGEQPLVPTEDLFALLRPHLPAVPPEIEALVASRTVESENMKRREVIGQHTRIAPAQMMRANLGGETVSQETGDITRPYSPEAAAWSGWGTALKPAQEPIVLARKPLVGTVAANVLQHGTGGINVDACRIGTKLAAGRWPANVLFDEDAAAVLGEPSRFFYVAKASRAEREAGLEAAGLPIRSGGELTDREDGSDGLNSPRAGAGRKGGRRNHHPTVKPVALMRYLIRLITPPGGLVLDPFAGSGTTGIAAKLEGFRFVGCEMEPEYVTLARARIEAA